MFSEILALGLSYRDNTVYQPSGKLKTDWFGITPTLTHFLGQLLKYLLMFFFHLSLMSISVLLSKHLSCLRSQPLVPVLLCLKSYANNIYRNLDWKTCLDY